MFRPGLALVFAALVSTGSGLAVLAAEASRAVEDRREPAVVVQRVHWPVTIESRRRPANAGETCAGLRPEQIEVLEDGEPQQVTAIGARPLPRLYALLIDTSRSMERDLDLAKGAAVSFVDSLPPDDTALVASFDDDLILGAGWTHDKQVLRNAVHQLRTGDRTALWDALHDVMLYLEGRAAAEKIVILVTDGEDSSSLPSHTFERVLEQARSLPDLVVFPVGLGLGASSRGESFSASSQLRQLARATGGEFFDIQTVSRLSAVFDGVQQRLAARRYVSYIPRARDRATRREPGDGGVRRRRVKIDVAAGVPCKVSSLGPDTRAERDDEATARRMAIVPNEEAAGAQPLFEETLPSVTEVLRWESGSPVDSGASSSSRFFVTQHKTKLFGSALDLLVDRGPLFRRQPGIFASRWLVLPDRMPVFGERGFIVETPPLAFVREHLTGPERVLLFMLERDYRAAQQSEGLAESRAPIFVHGRTFLELREFLGRTLFRTREDYRRWAEERTTSRIEAQIATLLQGLPPALVDDPAALAGLRSGLLFRETHGPRSRAPFDLVEWLADVPALSAVIDLERVVLNGLLSGGETAEPTAHRVERDWNTLRRWFAPATSARVLTPLVPAYDPELDRLGFYRLTLPRPRSGSRNPPTIPARPWALQTMRWLLRMPAIRRTLLDRSEVRSLRYDLVNRKRLRQLDCLRAAPLAKRPAGSKWIEVALDLRPRGSGPSDPMTLTAYFPDNAADHDGDPAAPACVTLQRPEVAPVGWHEAATVLFDTLGGDASAR